MFAKKSLSQNFLIDGNILKKIIKEASVQENDIVIEIGSGPGALTEQLLIAKASVFAIEKDTLLAKTLDRLSEEGNHLKVFNEDCLDFEWESFFHKLDLSKNKKVKIVANLPYKITTPILAILAPFSEYISSITVMVQKEVAERFIAKPGSKNYSSFTVFLDIFSIPRYCFTISPNCFYPKPRIYSALVQLTLKPVKQNLNIDMFLKWNRELFQNRRKMLKSSLKTKFETEKLNNAFLKTGISGTKRPEELSTDELIELFRSLNDH
ncbi:MAG: 16S rRNA (adenine(1518)-N(6)/adenine(1519)-N(6))-dimethyltransferase RsmA [Rhabdochlamydiaceae bacterium]